MPEKLTDYRRGYLAGYASGCEKTIRQFEEPDYIARTIKYDFGSLAVDQSKSVVETNTRRVYHAARMWARRNAPTRKFRVLPNDDGTTITRVF